MKEKRKSFKNWKLCTTISILIIITIIAIIFYQNMTNEVSNSDIAENNLIGKDIKLTSKNKKELYEKVKEDITKDLKTPSTSTFPNMKDWDIKVNYNNIIEVKSYVDSHNSYGAMLRCNFEQQFILLNENSYLCIYKKFNNSVEFDITKESQYSKLINKKLKKTEVDEILKGSSIIYDKMSYEFNEETQELAIEITEEEKNSYNIRTSVYSCIKTEINQCFCMPTINMNIIVKNENGEKLAEVKDIDFNFLITRWNTLIHLQIKDNISYDDLEEKLEGKMWQNDRIKEIDLQYIDTSVFYN